MLFSHKGTTRKEQSFKLSDNGIMAPFSIVRICHECEVGDVVQWYSEDER